LLARVHTRRCRPGKRRLTRVASVAKLTHALMPMMPARSPYHTTFLGAGRRTRTVGVEGQQVGASRVEVRLLHQAHRKVRRKVGPDLRARAAPPHSTPHTHAPTPTPHAHAPIPIHTTTTTTLGSDSEGAGGPGGGGRACEDDTSPWLTSSHAAGRGWGRAAQEVREGHARAGGGRAG
jgi:hypothetical protein